MKIIDCIQGSEKWLLARAGKPTASEFDNLITPLGKPTTGQGRQSYLLKKVAERAMGYPLQTFAGGALEQGSILEGEALPWLEFAKNLKVNRVGFCTTDDGRIGCSPDGLIGEDGGIEIKCPEPHTHLKYLLDGKIPADYVAQVQGSLFVTGRAWWYFLSYNRNFPALFLKIEPDPAFQAALGAALKTFLEEFDKKYADLQAIINPP